MRDVCKKSEYILKYGEDVSILIKNGLKIGVLKYGFINGLLGGFNTGDIIKVDISEIKDKYKSYKKQRGLYFLLLNDLKKEYKLYLKDSKGNIKLMSYNPYNQFENDLEDYILKVIPSITNLRLIINENALEFENNLLSCMEDMVR